MIKCRKAVPTLLEWLKGVPLNYIDTLINFCELVVLFVPASAAFLYYKIKPISVWVIETTETGATFLLHNGTNRSVFIKDICVRAKRGSSLSGMGTSFDKKPFCLKPDEIKEIVVHYSKSGSAKQTFWLVVSYNHRKKKTIRERV